MPVRRFQFSSSPPDCTRRAFISTEHVLVTEWLDGVSLVAAGPLIEAGGLDRAELARTLLRCRLRG